ncbi:lactonase family protein [Nocardia sp. NPDC051052]|uniref:lactonase family protein n=1 Tax=Nocardia sp. NPDC051052 TaxID=3364322 RepID=UPI0037BC507C
MAHPISEPAAAASGTVYVTNSDSNNVSVFSIGAGGALSKVHEPVGDCGEDPRAIVAAPNGRTIYVSNTGANHISAFRVGAHGSLTCLQSPIRTDGDDPFGLALSPDGRRLYVANIGSGKVTVFTVEPDGKLVRPKTYPTGATSPRGVAASPDGRFVYVSHGRPMPETEPGRLTILAVRPDGSLHLVNKDSIHIGLSGAMLALPRSGRFLYVGAQRSDQIFGFGVGSDGTLTPVPRSPFPAPGFPEGVAVTPDGRHVYAAGQQDGAGGVHGFVVATDGSLSPVPHSPFKKGTSQVGIAVTPDSRYIYTSGDDSTPEPISSVYGFSIDDAGTVHDVARSPIKTGGTSPAFQSVAIIANRLRQ